MAPLIMRPTPWLTIWFMVPNPRHLCSMLRPKGRSGSPMDWACWSSRRPVALPFGLGSARAPLRYVNSSEHSSRLPFCIHHETAQTTLAQLESPPMDTQSIGRAGDLFFALSTELYGPYFVEIGRASWRESVLC